MGGVSIKLNIKSSMSRMMMIRCAFESWDLSASNDVPTSIFGPILTYLGWPEGQKSAKIVEISASPTPLQMADFSLFRENKAPAREICSWWYPMVIKNLLLSPKETSWHNESVPLDTRGCGWGPKEGTSPTKLLEISMLSNSWNLWQFGGWCSLFGPSPAPPGV